MREAYAFALMSRALTISMSLMIGTLFATAVVLQFTAPRVVEAVVEAPAKSAPPVVADAAALAAAAKEKRAGERKQKIEQFLQEKGRTAVNLYAAARAGGELWPTKAENAYLIELSRLREDPVAMTLIAHPGDLAIAQRARELDPDNAYAILMEARALYEGEKITPRVIELLQLLKEKTRYERYEAQVRDACHDVQFLLTGDAREAWKEALLVSQWLGDGGDRMLVPLENRMVEMAAGLNTSAGKTSWLAPVLHLAQLPGSFMDETLSYNLVHSLGGNAPQMEERKEAISAQRYRETSFIVALDLASAEDLAAFESEYRLHGLDAAREQLIDKLGREEIARRTKEQLQDTIYEF